MTSIDLNADLGEGFGSWRMGNDEAMLEIVTSANIACGFHAGDPLIMSRTVETALANNVALGAHPGYHDLRGFGRTPMPLIAPDQLSADLIYQMGALQGIIKAQGGKLAYVKLHGALANASNDEPAIASVCVQAIRRFDTSLPLLVMVDSLMAQEARTHGSPTISEFYADRAYENDGQLVSRAKLGAHIDDPHLAADRVLKVLETGTVAALDGTELPLMPQSICLHGDNPHAVQMAETIRERLEKSGIRVEKIQP